MADRNQTTTVICYGDARSQVPHAKRYLADRYAPGRLSVLGLKHLDANLGHTAIRNPQAARGSERGGRHAVCQIS